MFRSNNKRPLKFAGSWYEADPKKLGSQLEAFDGKARAKLTELAPPMGDQPVLAIVAPHAGYAFSGQTAACSFSALEKGKVKRVFLLGPSHYRGFPGAALSTDKSFATVFGDLAVDTNVVADLKNASCFSEMTDVHRDEHSLEMQTAFIKKDFGDVKIVPILIGRLDDAAEARLIASQIKRQLRDGDLIVVSSDFTHFGPRYGYVPFKGDFAANVKKLDLEAFSFLQNHDLDGFFAFYQRTEDTICGVYALSVLLAMLPDDAHGHLIDYRTSRDSVVEDSQNSVSYLAIAFTSSENWTSASSPDAKKDDLTAADKKILIDLARATVDKVVTTGATEPPELHELGIEINNRLKKPQGVFVTLFKHQPDHSKELRGCIGYIMPVKPLYQAVIDNATAACTRDFRFTRVEANELQAIEIEISALSNPYPVPAARDIRIGTDGVLLFCQGKQSVFLPHVATEYGWDLDETLNQLSVKAGLSKQAWKSAGARFEVFQAVSIDSKDY